MLYHKAVGEKVRRLKLGLYKLSRAHIESQSGRAYFNISIQCTLIELVVLSFGNLTDFFQRKITETTHIFWKCSLVF